MARTFLTLLMLLVSVCLTNGRLVAQENWTRFHGENGSGLALSAKLPKNVDA